MGFREIIFLAQGHMINVRTQIDPVSYSHIFNVLMEMNVLTLLCPVLTTTQNKAKHYSLVHIFYLPISTWFSCSPHNQQQHPAGSIATCFLVLLQYVSPKFWFHDCCGLFFNVCKGKGKNTVPSLLSNATTHQVTKHCNPGYAGPDGACILPWKHSCWMQLWKRLWGTQTSQLFRLLTRGSLILQ